MDPSKATVLEHIQVIGLGQACVDHLGRLPGYPAEDEKVELNDLEIQCGGPASSAMVALSRLGVKTAFLGAISDDPFGRMILENLSREGVDTSLLALRPGYASQYAFIGVTEATGKRTIFWHRGTVGPLLPEDVDRVDLKQLPNARILHVDSLMTHAAGRAAQRARDEGIRVVMDGGTMREGTRELLRHVDVLIASRSFAVPVVGTETPVRDCLRTLQEMGPREVVITLGSRGSMGTGEAGLIRQEAFAVSAKDTTGAGDAYHGGYIYGLLQGWDMGSCMRFAAAVAALKCTQVGAQAGAPSLEAVDRFLRARS